MFSAFLFAAKLAQVLARFSAVILWLPVKLMFANQILDCSRYEIANGLATRNPVSDIGRRNVDVPADGCVGMLRSGSGAIEHRELHHLRKLGKPVPGRKFCDIVFADQTDELRVWLASFQCFDGFDGVRWRRANEFKLIEAKPRFAFNRRPQHFYPQVGGDRMCSQLVGRKRRRNEKDAIQFELLDRVASQDQMAAMNGIERAAEDADLFHFLVIPSLSRNLSLFLPDNREILRLRSASLRMTIKESTKPLGQLILTGVPGYELDPQSAALFRRVQPGGYILFGRNIQSPLQLRKLIDDLRDLSQVEPIITIDQEGGRVSRLRLIGNEPPNAQQLRDRGDVALVRRHGDITGRLLRLFGFNLDLCPVLDISFDDDADNSLRGRCYGRNVEQVVQLAGAFNDGMRGQGILGCGKHFPGYSAATVDAHHDLPKIERSRAELDHQELAVFRQFVSNVDSMMICHGWYPAFNPAKRPASLSREIVTGLLREEFGYDGLVMTDDLDMGAILNEYGLDETIRLAIEAGNDWVMICHRVAEIEKVHSILGKLPAAQIERAQRSVAQTKARLAGPDEFSEAKFKEIDGEIWELRVAVLGEEEAARRSPEDGKRSPVETY
jgi:beta-N-acetylhexosaminidase